ncbi:AAA family ATPase [Roseospirillum parvum]|uniref:DNA transposition protein, AAA+ family ATPase n=1 Tax=Roseospirillum parvum TaxID=83401 RepID=A0A1G8GKQ6_9PROT|nr:AAA family ATPase [Roseospirillum parvum]SDH94901.1 hypothetical protein SAMN05421742_1302 [Roseospirillum parvum]
MSTVPEQTAMTEEVQADLRRQIEGLIDNEGLTQAAIASEAGIAYGTFTGWYRGTYGGNTEKIAGQVVRWLKSRQERARTAATLPTPPSFIATSTTAKITSILQYAQIAPDIAVIAGDAGTSKTSTCEEYCRTTPHAYMATMDPSCASANAMLAEICSVVGVTERLSTRLSRAIGEQLRGRSALLIIDEAQHLSVQALEQLRSLHDKHGLGLALVGNVSIYSRIDGGRTATFAQLFSRVGMRLTKTKPSRADVAALIEAWKIAGDEERQFLTGIAHKPGALRQMTKTIRLACVAAAGDGSAVTIEHLRTAYGRLAMDVH